MKFQRNVGQLDRLVRFVIALACLYFAFYFPGIANDPVSSTILLLIALVFLLVVTISYCPIYALIDVSTCQADATEDNE